ncbi:MAG: hypothetical protein LH472_04920 [Pyrinomonadaceae bacterium]|nr:hypothetical protein [Pyrinomonadaceae bacterium]
MKKTILVLFFLTANFSVLSAQTNQPARTDNQSNYYPQTDPLQTISQEITKISKSVQNLNGSIKELLEKLAGGKGMQLTARQQKLLLGYEILNRAEQRLEILQKFQIELTQKDGELKTRLAQIEEALLPGSIERNTAFIGTTKGDELRETRKRALETERRSLQTLSAQISRHIQQNGSELQQAENFVSTLRRKILPPIEIEISDL